MSSFATRLLRGLRSPRLVLGVLAFLAGWCAFAAWAPWTRGPTSIPGWAAALGLERPLASWPFFVATALLFASIAACALPRFGRCLALSRGALPPSALLLPARPGRDLGAFLRARGFGGRGSSLFRWRAGFWGGWLMHVGLLVLIAGVAAQQLFHDEGRFHLATGETASLAAPGVVNVRERGPLASRMPPDVEIALTAFDPFQHQTGYAPDRRSRLQLRRGPRYEEAVLDRAAGVTFEELEVYQAIPTGLALRLEWPDGAYAVLHLFETGPHRSEVQVDDPMLGRGVFSVESERDAHDPQGTGRLTVRLEADGQVRELGEGAQVGSAGARVVRVDRWGEYKYSRDPGLGGVFAGFFMVLAGSVLLALPAGVAQLVPAADGDAGRLFLPRGGERLLAQWLADGDAAPGGGV
jgi:cytochrome c biogenesis protein